jgi:hypothetical protein
LQQVRQSYEDAQRATLPALPAELSDQFRHICDRLPQLWQSASLCPEHKKSLLRSLIARVLLTREPANSVTVRIVWVSGHYSVFSTQPPVFSNADLGDYPRLVEAVQTLWGQGLSDEAIAQHLTQAGFRSARQAFVSAKAVQTIRLRNGWRRIRPQNQRLLEVEGFLTVKGLAARLGVSREWVRHRIRTRQLDPQYVQRHAKRDMILIQDCPQVIALLQQQLSSQATSQ